MTDIEVLAANIQLTAWLIASVCLLSTANYAGGIVCLVCSFWHVVFKFKTSVKP